MNKPSVKNLIVACSLILVILIVILAFQLRNEIKIKDFYSLQTDVDRNINSAFYTQAVTLLEASYKDIYSSKTALMYLKRAAKLGDRTGDYSFLKNKSAELSRRFNNNIEISAVYAYSLQKQGLAEESLRITDLHHKKSEYAPLHMLNILHTDANRDDATVQRYFQNEYSLNITNISESDFIAAFDQNNDDRFLLNASLLAAAEQGSADAVEILKHTKPHFQPGLKALMYYDKGDFVKAYEYLSKADSESSADEESMLIGCDILIKNGYYDEAAIRYEKMIMSNPETYSIPYRNLYSFNRNNSTGAEWLAAGLVYFPEDPLLLIPAAWEMQLKNNSEGTESLLEKLGTRNPKTELFRLNLKLTGRSPEHIVGNFWNIYNMQPDSRVIAVSFAGYLLKHRFTEQLNMLLKRYSEASGDDGWVYTYSAIGSALDSNIEAAKQQINSALLKDKSLMNYYNKGVIFLLSGDLTTAYSMLQQALTLSETVHSEDIRIAKVLLKTAETAYLAGDIDEAGYYSRKLLAIDPNNMRANLLKNKIQELY